MSDIYKIINVDKTNDCTIMHVRNYNGAYLVIDENLGDYNVGQDIELWPQYEYSNGFLVLKKLIIPPEGYAKIRKELQLIRDLLVEIELGVKKQWQRKNLM
jgi:hypothetical protein